MNRQNSVESEQMLRTERSSRSVDKGRMLLLFDSSILQGDCHFVEEFSSFESPINNGQSQRSSTEEKQEKTGTGQELNGWD